MPDFMQSAPKERSIQVSIDETFERIKLATRTRTQIELANVLNIRQSSISDAKRRNSIPSDWCIKLFERYGLNPDWIKKGQGPMYLKTEAGYLKADVEEAPAAKEENTPYANANTKNALVSVFSMLAWDGGALKTLDKIALPLTLTGPSIVTFRLDSTSMEPLLRKGAYIGVDTSQRQIVSGELYAVVLPHGGIAVSHVFPCSAGRNFSLKVENPQHPEMTMPAETFDENVVGRVVWSINKY